MDVQDGFIVGIFNYCDRWCETCGLTARCRSFALDAEMLARLDPSMRALAEAPLRPEDHREPPQWLQEILKEANPAVSTGERNAEVFRQSSDDHQLIEDRARQYGRASFEWLKARGAISASDPRNPLAIIGWFGTFIPGKVARATFGLANDDGAFKEYPADHDGSAKAAMLAIERSHAAWRALVDDKFVPAAEAAKFLEDLNWLAAALDQAFPQARAFVRPGFDEPEAVAKLEAAER